MEADPFPTLAVCFVGNFGGPNFISGYYDRKVPAFAPPFWVETLKTVVEGHLSSSYTSFYEMTQVTPLFHGLLAFHPA